MTEVPFGGPEKAKIVGPKDIYHEPRPGAWEKKVLRVNIPMVIEIRLPEEQPETITAPQEPKEEWTLDPFDHNYAVSNLGVRKYLPPQTGCG